jgi:uncharacterized protein YndB with AHSA1/START domain
VEPTISRSITVSAPAELVWSLVTDLPRMDRFSPENIGGYWVEETGPALGARFRGTNRNGRKLWHTRVRVVQYVPGRRFTFDVRTPFGVRVSRWCYEITPSGAGCVLTEHWYRVGSRFVRNFLGPRVTGRADRPGFNTYSIEHTLAAVKDFAENSAQAAA